VAKVTMPQLGESVAEGTIGKWLKQPGDQVAKYEPLLEVITDKVNAEVPSPFEGVLKEILAEEGATVPNNAEIAIIQTADEADEGAAAGAAVVDGAGGGASASDGAVSAEPATAPGKASAVEETSGPAESDERPAQPAAAGSLPPPPRQLPPRRRPHRPHPRLRPAATRMPG
jgi:2-oxoisovalerate dehydrogenase E2 component (dihydrolipoyl transacylase)